METEIIDKLFLELSQVSTARTEKQIILERTLSLVLDAWELEVGGAKNFKKGDKQLFNRAMSLINSNYKYE